MFPARTDNSFLPELPPSDEIAARKGAPRTDWSHMGESEHFVQFYETDLFLLNAVGGFIGTGISAGEGCVVVATRAHLDAIEEQLQAGGVDVNAVRASGQYVGLDAAETLAEFMVDDSPDPVRFAGVIGSIIARAAEGRSRVRAFGEMVALLWAEDNRAAAIRLEELWNELQSTHSFVLFCAYPMNGFGGEELAEPLGAVCATHSRVIPAESYTALGDVDERLRAILQLQQKATSLEREIAERKEAEIALRGMKEELEAQVEDQQRLLTREQMARAEAETADRLKDEFLATVSHELRTPLNAILGWVHLLRNAGLDEATACRAVETIERNARSQAQLIEDILDVSRVITGKLRLNIGSVDVAAVINAAIDSVQLAADSKNIQLGVILDPSARHVSGDASRLQQVVWNLLSNAIKFTPAGGRVEVRLEHENANIQISVSDNGQGISGDFLPFMFDRFRQADGTSTRRHGGLGLGLAIARHLVELHGGTIDAQSSGKGFGSTFTITLPLAVAPDARSRRQETGALISDDAGARLKPARSLDGVKVLLVDDDRDSLQILTLMLIAQRANVHAACSVDEALQALQWYKPDVLVSDLAMPGEDGYSLIRKIRALELGSGQQTPAVALTAYVRVDDRTRALTAGFNMFVPKPVEPSELITCIASLYEAHGPHQ